MSCGFAGGLGCWLSVSPFQEDLVATAVSAPKDSNTRLFHPGELVAAARGMPLAMLGDPKL